MGAAAWNRSRELEGEGLGPGTEEGREEGGAAGKDAAAHLDAHEEVGAVLEVAPAAGEGAARGVDGGVGVGGGVELPDLAADVGVLRAEPGVPAPLRDPQAPHRPPQMRRASGGEGSDPPRPAGAWLGLAPGTGRPGSPSVAGVDEWRGESREDSSGWGVDLIWDLSGVRSSSRCCSGQLHFYPCSPLGCLNSL